MARSKGIFKRAGSPYWWISYIGADGKRKRESTKSELKTEAEYILSCKRKAAMEGILPPTPKMQREKKKQEEAARKTFSDLKTEYLAWAIRQKAYKSKKNRVELLYKDFGNIPLDSFTTKLVDQYQTDKLKGCGKLQKDGRPATGNKPATINRLLATLKHMFTKAVEWDMVSDTALKHVRRVKLLQENNRRLRYLTQEECAALIGACMPHLKPIVITAIHTGMRKGEILGLTWDRVDLTHGFILLDTNTKNGERREIPISNTLKDTLETLALDNVEGHRHVFHNKEGQPYKELKNSFHAACRTAGIADFHFHDLRHTFASHLAMSGADLTTMKELLGHKTITMTLRYAHLAPSHKVNAIDLLDARMKDIGHNLDTIERRAANAAQEGNC